MDTKLTDKEDNDRIECVVLDEEENTGNKDVEYHREDLEYKVLEERVHGTTTTECARDLADFLAQVKVQGEPQDMLEGCAREAAEERL